MFILEPRAGGAAYHKAAEAFRQMYLSVTGIELSIKNTPGDTEDMIVIGTDAVQPFAFAKIEGGFPVRSGSDDYCIISKEDNGRTLLFLGGGRGRAALYAVYDFFERRAGCHYFWDGDVIPHMDTVDIHNLHVVESPRFEYRAIRYFAHRGLTRFQAEHWDWEEWKRELDWVVKSRLNLIMLRTGMDDLFQKAFPNVVAYPPEDEKLPGAGEGYNNRTTSWSLQYRGRLRKKVLNYAFDCDLMHPEDFGTMTHWYSRTPMDYLEAVKPKLMSQLSTSYSEQTGQVWDIFDDDNVENYMKLTETHIKEYGKPDIFHTIGLAERKFSDDPKKNLELKMYAYKRFMSHIHDKYPNAKTLIAAWDFYFRLTPAEVKEIMKLFDPENTLILDYTVDLKFEKSNMDKWGIIGKFPWIFGLFHGYMPQSHVHGDYEYIAEKVAQADADPFCKGMDFWPELSHSDTLMLAYFTENAWKPTGRNIEEVAKDMCRKRYPGAEEKMWDVWNTALPLLRLPNINYTSCAFNILQHATLNRLANTKDALHFKTLEQWADRVVYEKSFDCEIARMIDKIRHLPKEVMEAPFVVRDCVDLVRSVITEKLHIDLMDACIAFSAWQKGKESAETVLAKWDACEKLMAGFADVLDTHGDYSMYRTLVDQGKNRKVNPYFEDALKDNLLNNYCRTAAFELVKFVYCKELAVYKKWVTDSIAAGKAGGLPAETFKTERDRIFDRFKALPLKDMHPAGLQDIYQVLDSVLPLI